MCHILLFSLTHSPVWPQLFSQTASGIVKSGRHYRRLDTLLTKPTVSGPRKKSFAHSSSTVAKTFRKYLSGFFRIDTGGRQQVFKKRKGPDNLKSSLGCRSKYIFHAADVDHIVCLCGSLLLHCPYVACIAPLLTFEET